MQLKRKTWYVRLYLACLEICRTWSEDSEYVEDHEMTNLCSFMRTILLWAPLIILIHLFALTEILTLVVFGPIRFFGLTGYIAIIVAIGCLIGFYMGCIVLSTIISDKWEQRQQKKYIQTAATPRQSDPGFLRLIWDYIVAGKKKICPIIKLEN